MKFATHANSRRGMAMIIVMLAITVLSVFAGIFAARMKVETQLARNTNYEVDLEWAGRSGVELARYLVGQQTVIPNEGYSALRQKWAGGPGNLTNEMDFLVPIQLVDHRLGDVMIDLMIVDAERKLSINSLFPPTEYARQVLNDALNLAGATEYEKTTIIASLQDWLDPDDMASLEGAETEYYLGLPSPYFAKNGMMDEMTELLLVKGVTPDMFWGPSGPPSGGGVPIGSNLVRPGFDPNDLPPSVGLLDLFTAINITGLVNPNTASEQVLTLALGNDAALAAEIVKQRRGYDGVDGTLDDAPFESPQMAAGLAGLGGTPMVNRMTTRSMSFQVFVEARIGNVRREFVAFITREGASQTEPIIKFFHWR